MEKSFYYTITLGGDFFENIFYGDGNKDVTIYTIENNKPIQLANLDLEVTDNSKVAILNYLEDNGYGDETIKLTQL